MLDVLSELLITWRGSAAPTCTTVAGRPRAGLIAAGFGSTSEEADVEVKGEVDPRGPGAHHRCLLVRSTAQTNEVKNNVPVVPQTVAST
ncbi:MULTISPECIES: hypothetical protein [Streptomyces]|uniref:Uncharacterized protein n=2 Tax=Streptomyces TaxID=1883 RepID=A0ABV9J458_9ACTN